MATENDIMDEVFDLLSEVVKQLHSHVEGLTNSIYDEERRALSTVADILSDVVNDANRKRRKAAGRAVFGERVKFNG